VKDWPVLSGESPLDVSGLKIRGVSTREELNTLEAKNIRKVYMKYLAAKPSDTLAPFSLNWLNQLHKEMFGEVWEWAGSYRTTNLNIGCDKSQIQMQLKATIDNLAYWKTQGVDVLLQSARFHHQVVQIHPYINGNGRWSRLLGNIWLAKHGHPLTSWPESNVAGESEIRDEYLLALKSADDGDESLLIKLHARYT